ncbi:hypothetical protein KKD37_04530 [Patescibacteria group bacterium]|nr:hypothetical protein [Patescibacteria group bacterium]
MKNIIIGLLLGLVIAMLAFYLFSQKPTTQTDLPPLDIPTSVEDTPTSTIPPVSDELSIKQALADKYHKDLSEVNFTLSKNDGEHASGGVIFSGEISGGWVLAAKVNQQWLIVQDGNGTVSCETVAPYNFPVSMVPGCVDQNGQLQNF